MKYISILLFLLLSSCASKYGTKNDVKYQKEKIVSDAIIQIKFLYPPALTTFSLIHNIEIKDKFGSILIEKMRNNGYAIQEYSKNKKQIGIPFGYTLDKVNAYSRLTIYIGNKRLSRFAEFGYWTLLED